MRPFGSAAALEARRRKAAELLNSGLSIGQVARRVHAHRSSVKRWKRALAQGGAAGLSARPHPGPTPRLSVRQEAELVELLRAGPEAAGFQTNLWTMRRVAEVIQRRFAVQYHFRHMGRLMRRLGFSPQRPQRRARERDEAAIRRWREHDWPRIKKGGAGGKLASSFSTKPGCNSSRSSAAPGHRVGRRLCSAARPAGTD